MEKKFRSVLFFCGAGRGCEFGVDLRGGFDGVDVLRAGGFEGGIMGEDKVVEADERSEDVGRLGE